MTEKTINERVDAAIIGYGPTGGTLAHLLALQGLSVAIIERENEIYDLPRAVHFDDEVMRVFQTIGIADALREQVFVNIGMRFVDRFGDVLLDWPRPQELSPQGWHASYRFHQPDLERLLRSKMATRQNVEAHLGCKVTEITDTGSEVQVSFQDLSTDTRRQISAKFAIGCDGAGSLTRRTLGIEMQDFGFQERWLVVDFLLKRPRPDLGDHTLQYCVPERPMTYCRSPENRRRWEIAIKDHELSDAVSAPNQVWEFLQDFISPEDADLERSAVYTFQSKIAKEWRKGRILIAGDAAHLTPPFMGQGMCAGIRDASNLAWKLAKCIQEHSDPNLLESYGQERAPHAQEYILTAIKLGKLMNSLDKEGVAKLRQDGAMKSIAPKLGTSNLFDPDASDFNALGRPAAQPKLANGQRLDDAIGYRSALITSKPLAQPPDIPCFSAQDHPELREILDDCSAVLIRPDRYIQAVAYREDEIEAIVALARKF